MKKLLKVKFVGLVNRAQSIDVHCLPPILLVWSARVEKSNITAKKKKKKEREGQGLARVTQESTWLTEDYMSSFFAIIFHSAFFFFNNSSNIYSRFGFPNEC